MDKIRIMLLFICLSLMLYAGFDVTESAESITVSYIPDANMESRALLLPPAENINISVSDSRIGKDTYYLGDYHLMALPAADFPYTVNVSIPSYRNPGRKITENDYITDFIKDLAVNGYKCNEYKKARYMPSTKSSYNGTPIAAISVDSTAIYRIYFSQLQAVTSTDLTAIDPRTIQMFNRNREIALYISNINDSVFNTGDFIEFFGMRHDPEGYRYYGRYDTDNHYVITADGAYGARYVQYTSSISNDSLIKKEIDYFIKTVHIEEDSFFYRFKKLSADTSDFWFDMYMTDPNTYDYYLSVKNRVPGTPLTVRSLLHGVSHLGINPDHPMDILVNDSIINSINWNDQVMYLFENDSVMTEDTMEIKISYNIKNIGSDSLLFNHIMLNWTEVAYTSRLRADNGEIHFTVDDSEGFGRFRFIVGGFTSSNIEVLRNNLKRINGFVVEFDTLSSTYTVIFEDDIYTTGVHYGVYQKTIIQSPSIEQYANGGLSSPLNRGEFVIITDSELKNDAEAVKALFDEEIFIAGTDEIYNEFSHGFTDPQGIRDFLKTAYNSWELAPTHVLLLGDASRDQNNHLGKTKYYIPSAYLYGLVDFGYSCTDNYYARVVGDDYLEDISVSRYPVNSPSDISSMINKIQHYNDPRNQGTHYLRALMVYDTFDYIRSESDSRYLGNMLPYYQYAKYMRTYETWGPDFIPELHRGAFLMNVLAHGAVESIGYGMYLRSFDVYRYNNINRLPLLKVYSCNTNEYDYTSPDSISIGEAFATAPNGGAIGYYGATGTSEAGVNFILSRAVFRQFTERGMTNIGDIIRLGEAQFFFEASNPEPGNPFYYRTQEIMNYNLLGIGFLNMQIPRLSDNELTLSSTELGAADTLNVQLYDSSIDYGNMESIVLSSSKQPVSHDHSEIFSHTGVNELIMPDSIEMGNLTVLTVSSSPDTALLYSAFPSIGNAGIVTFGMQPQNPDTTQSFILYARIKNRQGMSDIRTYYRRELDGNYSMMTLTADSSDSTLYVSDTIGPLKASSDDYKFLYYIGLTDTADNVINTAEKSYLINGLPDFSFYGDSLKIASINRLPYISMIIKNYSGRFIPQFATRISNVSTDTALIAVDTAASISGNSFNENIWVRNDENIENMLIEFDIYDEVSESDENNNTVFIEDFNTDIYYIDDDITDKNMSMGNMDIGVESRFRNYGSFIALSEDLLDNDIEGIMPYTESGSGTYSILKLFNGDTTACTVNLSCTDSIVNDSVFNIYHYSSIYGKYLLADESIVNAYADLESGLNKFVIASHNDSVPPFIDIIIENDDYVGNVILSEQCELSFTIEDESGIRKNEIIIVMNDDTLDAGEYIISDNSDIRSLPIGLVKRLDDGIYNITVHAEDIYSNSTTETMQFKVAQTFAIVSAGNFPNPATGISTVMACRITEQADEVILHIFNAAGSRVGRFSFVPGNEMIVTYNLDITSMPNGTYFYYFEANRDNGSETVKSRIEKMSVLR